MATRTPKASLGLPPTSPAGQLPDDVQGELLTSPIEPSTPATAPDVPPPAVETPPETVQEKGVDTEPEKPRILVLAEKELSAMIEKLQSNLDSLKAQKEENPDHLSLIKLSCAKVLREATHKVAEMEETVQKMRTVSEEARTRQMNLDTAIENNRKRSISFRTERAAFIKLKGMSEKEYYALVNELMDREKKSAA